MAIKIGSGVASTQFGPRQLAKAQQTSQEHLARLSSGLRLLSAADDSASLAISQDMRADLRGIDRAAQNANDGVSVAQVADGALQEIGGMLSRLRELSTQAANGTLNDEQRSIIDKEFQAIKTEISRVVETTEFNGTRLIDGSSEGISIQVGGDAGEENRIEINIENSDTTALGLGSAGISGEADARSSIASVHVAIDRLSERRVGVGTAQNRLEGSLRNLSASRVNLEASRSRIEDADLAQEVSALAASNIRSQMSVAMQAQANVAAGLSLSLIG
ncbi:MAG: flagellin [Nannocystaceae bacterium]